MRWPDRQRVRNIFTTNLLQRFDLTHNCIRRYHCIGIGVGFANGIAFQVGARGNGTMTMKVRHEGPGIAETKPPVELDSVGR